MNYELKRLRVMARGSAPCLLFAGLWPATSARRLAHPSGCPQARGLLHSRHGAEPRAICALRAGCYLTITHCPYGPHSSSKYRTKA